MNTTTQINTDDFAITTTLEVTYDINEFCDFDENIYYLIDNAIEESLYLTRQQGEIVFTNCHDIFICEKNEIATVLFHIKSIKGLSEIAIKRQLLSTVSMLHLDYEHNGCTATYIDAL